MNLSKTLEARSNVVLMFADKFDNLVSQKIETVAERNYALDLAEKIEAELDKMIRDVRQLAMTTVPARSDVK